MTHRNAFSLIALALAFDVLSLQRATAQEAQPFEQRQLLVKPGERIYIAHSMGIPPGPARKLQSIDVSQATAAIEPAYTTYLKPELFVSAGHAVAGNWLLSECCPPHWGNLGIGLTIRLSRRVGVEMEGNRMIGAEPAQVSGILFRPSDGTHVAFKYHDGVSSLTIASGNILYYFSDKRVQPYLSGGIGAIFERGTFGQEDLQNGRTIEQQYRDNEASGALGGGVRISVTPRISVRPEVRLYIPTGSLHAITRASVAVAYQW